MRILRKYYFFFFRFLFVVKFSFSSIDSSKLGFISSTLIKGEVVIFSSAFKTLIVINRYHKIIGTVSDGDIRRGILKFQKLDTSVIKIMKKKFFCFTHKNIKKFNYDKLKKNNIQLIPEIDKNRISTRNFSVFYF